MLTLESILRTSRHMAAHGETGPHRFGKGYDRQQPRVPRDRTAKPKTPSPEE